MATRIRPIKPGESPDPKVNEMLQVSQDGWFADTAMFGAIGRRPELLKSIIPVFEAFFAKGLVEPHIFELMRIKTGQVNDCQY